jgi:hypothetical protein
VALLTATLRCVLVEAEQLLTAANQQPQLPRGQLTSLVAADAVAMPKDDDGPFILRR